MVKGRIAIAMVCCMPVLATVAHSQSKQKPGLWEVTTQMSMTGMPQMPQMPAGVQMQSPFAPHTSQICVSQAMIDKYGGPYQNPQRGDCQVTNVSVKADGMTANIACTGQMSAKGDVTMKWTDGNTTDTTMHLTGTMQMGPNTRPVDMTIHSTGTYKGSDCGSVKPIQMPAGN
jgi:hypothetical protein